MKVFSAFNVGVRVSECPCVSVVMRRGEVEFTFHFPEVKGQDAVLQPRLYFL